MRDRLPINLALPVRKRRRAIFRADARAQMGGGHVMRCLTLAERLHELDWSIGFACVSETLAVVSRLRNRAEILDAATGDELDARALKARWPSGCDVLIVDHYALDAAFETSCRGWAAKIAVIDDLADRSHDCDMLVDTTPGRAAEEYDALTPSNTMVLAGSAYTLLRPEFAAAREASIAGRVGRQGVERILVALGLTDLGGMTERVARALLELLSGKTSIELIIGGSASSKMRLEKLAASEPRLHLHVDPPNVASLMAAADLAIGAGGTTSWERCCLGVPTVSLVLASNQALVAARLADIGAAVVLPSLDGPEFAATITGLVNDPSRLQRMSAAAAALVDGRGTERVAFAVRGLVASPTAAVKLRAATSEDSTSLWEWRNDPVSRTNSHSGALVPWDEHDHWFKTSLDKPGRLLWVAILENQPIGMVRFDRREDSEFVISINIAPERRGRGLGLELLGVACTTFADIAPHARLHAEVKTANSGSRRIFESCHFVPTVVTKDLVIYKREGHEFNIPGQ